MSKIGLFFSITLIIGIFLVLILLVANKAVLAAEPGDEDGVDLKIKIEASTDHGATWVNFSGTDFSGNQSITANPGDQIDWRLKLWNEGAQLADNVDISEDYENEEYIDDITITDFDLDNDGREFDSGDISRVDENTSENVGYQGVSGTITLVDNFPTEQTTIIFGGNISDYDAGFIAHSPWQLVERAFAVGVGKESFVRIVVNENNTVEQNSNTNTRILPPTGKKAF